MESKASAVIGRIEVDFALFERNAAPPMSFDLSHPLTTVLGDIGM
jgi:hypothetical protein